MRHLTLAAPNKFGAVGEEMVAILALLALFGGVLTYAPVTSAEGFSEPPMWHRGERWHFTAHLPDRDIVFYDLTWEVGDRGVIASRETEGGHIQLQFYTKDLAWIGLDGQTVDAYGRLKYEPVLKFNPPIPLYRWPLMVGKSWERCSENTVLPGGTYCNSFKVLREETVSVPAGAFRAVVIEQRQDGKLLSRRWYAPEVKNIVKQERFVPYQNERLLMTIILQNTNVFDLALIDRGFSKLCWDGITAFMVYDPNLGRCVGAVGAQ